MIENLSLKQVKVLEEATSRWNILSGAVRSGKTFTSYFLLPYRVKNQGHGNFMLVGKTERTLRRNIIDPLRELYGEGNISNIYGDGLVDLFGRKAYVVGANDERAVTKIQGIGLVYCMGDEVTTWPESFFQMLKSRLDKPGAKFDGTCNPENPYHWLKTFLDTEGLDINYWHFKLDDNPFLDKQFVESLKQEYTGLWYKRYIEGLWVMAEGVIYDMWDEQKHVIECPLEHQEYYAAVDYATASVMTFGLYGVTDDAVYLVKEYYWDAEKKGRQKTDGQFADDFERIIEGYSLKEIYLDPSASSFKIELRSRGYSQVRDAKNEVIDGIRTVATLLSSGRFFVDKSCKDTISEFGSYVWDQKAQEQGLDKPLKQNDHAMDRNRYMIHTRFGKQQLRAVRTI